MQARYQYGDLRIRKRNKGPDVWQFRYFEGGRRKSVLIGTIERLPTKADAQRAVDHLRMKVNSQNPQARFHSVTVDTLIDRFIEEYAPKHYHARPFILRGIPLRRPPADQLTHTRRNGNFTLDIVGHPRFGLPFGQDRLIPVWVATLAVLQKSRMVRFASPSQMLDYFELPKNGYHYTRIVQGFQRIFGATIFFGTEEQRQRAVVLDSIRFHFFDRMQIWCNRQESSKHSSNELDNTITLSEAFHNEIDRHMIPIERGVVAALANAPGILDLYVWLVWRSWTIEAGRQARVPLFGSVGLDQQLGSKHYGRERDFRQKLAK